MIVFLTSFITLGDSMNDEAGNMIISPSFASTLIFLVMSYWSINSVLGDPSGCSK